MLFKACLSGWLTKTGFLCLAKQTIATLTPILSMKRIGMLQSVTNLSSVTNVWVTVTNVPVLTDGRYNCDQ